METSGNSKINEMKRKESFKRLINLVLSGFCLLIEVLLFTYYYLTQFYPSLNGQLYLNYWRNGYLLQIALYAVLLFVISRLYGGMRIGYLKNSEIIFSQILSMLIANVFIYFQMSLMVVELCYPAPFVEMTIVQALGIVIWINVANKIYLKVFPPRKLLLIHGDRPYDDIVSKFEGRKDKYEIVKCVNAGIGMEKLEDEIWNGYSNADFSAVVLWDISTRQRNDLMKYCYARSIRFYIMPKISDVILLGAEEMHLFDTPILLTREYSLSVEQRFVKRMIDIVFSLILLVIASPFMLLTALAVKLYDGGPVLYKQVRCTEGGRKFNILKFRSMRVDAEKDGVARLAKKNDDRITPVGRVIRKCRLDELPQLFNILKGDMSFVGPRPERPEIIEQYMEVMPEFSFRLKVKAGLAGYAQVFGKYNTSPYDKLKLDLTYIENYSLWLDIKLMFLTVKILFWPDSTEGVEAEQVTALRREYEQNKTDQKTDDY